MNGIHFLTDDDFTIKQGDKGLVLTLLYDAKGMTLILFYSTECPYCESLIKIFKQLPAHVNGCKFAMVNVNRNMNLIDKSKNTIAPISYVPDLILYVNGHPYVRYDGAHDLGHIKEFIFEINMKIKKMVFMDTGTAEHPSSNTIQPQHPSQKQSQPFQQQPQAQNERSNQDSIPAYTIGTPLFGERKKDKVCYLNFNNAYVST